MSFTMSENRHDTHIYDPDRHDNQIVAVFQDEAAADAAQQALLQAGIEQQAIQVVVQPAAEAEPAPSSAGDQIMNAFMSLFGSDDRDDYAHAVRRGHAMVVVTPTAETDRRQVIHALEVSAPIDFDAKLEEWRQDGYERMGNVATGDAEARRIGRREQPDGASRVRSYIADRPSGDKGMSTGGDVTNATPGATSSGMNAPRG